MDKCIGCYRNHLSIPTCPSYPKPLLLFVYLYQSLSLSLPISSLSPLFPAPAVLPFLKFPFYSSIYINSPSISLPIYSLSPVYPSPVVLPIQNSISICLSLSLLFCLSSYLSSISHMPITSCSSYPKTLYLSIHINPLLSLFPSILHHQNAHHQLFFLTKSPVSVFLYQSLPPLFPSFLIYLYVYLTIHLLV